MTVMETVGAKNGTFFVMGSVKANGYLVMGTVIRVTLNAMEDVKMKSGLGCVMVNAYGILIPVMASVVRGIFHVMVTMVDKDVTMKSIGKTVMGGAFGTPSPVHRLILLLA